MKIEQIIKYLPAPICGSTVIGKEKQKEYDAHDSAIIILRKYQKIREIAFPLQFCTTDKLNHEAIMKICEVIGDGNDD